MISSKVLARCGLCSRELYWFSPVFETERGFLCPDCLAAYLEREFPARALEEGREAVCGGCGERITAGEEYREIFGHTVHPDCLEGWSREWFFPRQALEERDTCSTYSYPSR